jgi:hypothetical protein
MAQGALRYFFIVRAVIRGRGNTRVFHRRPRPLSIPIFLFMNTLNPVQFYHRNPGLTLDFEIHGTPWILPWIFTILYF